MGKLFVLYAMNERVLMSNTDKRWAWQEAALRAIFSSNDRNALIVACPGSGKTRVGINTFIKMREEDRVRKVLIISPSINIGVNWKEKFADFGVRIASNVRNDELFIPNDLDGIAVCYQSVVSQPEVYRTLLSRTNYLVVLDEVHHCGEDLSWGRQIKRALEYSAFRLLLSGTPFRSDNDAIPFVHYKDGVGIPEFIFDYADALKSGCVRAVYFPKIGGTATYRLNDEVKSVDFDTAIPEDELGARYNTFVSAIDDPGCAMQLAAQTANGKLDELRECGDKDAGGLVICKDQEHARRIAEKMIQWTGTIPEIAISDDPEAHGKIESFKGSNKEWLIAVNMVSEGIDIPRLRIGIIATTITKELFFRQAVGRFLRVEDDLDDQTSYIYVMADPRIVSLAERIKEQRDAVIDEKVETALRETLGNTERESKYMPLGTIGEEMGFVFDGRSYDKQDRTLAEYYRSKVPGLPLIPNEQLIALLHAMKNDDASNRMHIPEAIEIDEHKKYRDLNNSVVRSIGYKNGIDYKDVNIRLNNRIGVRKIHQATIEQLKQRLKHAQEWLRLGRAP